MGFKNDNALKQKLEQKGSGGLPIVRVTNDNSPLTVRFLTAPTEWLTTLSYFDEDAKRSVIVEEGDHPPKGKRLSERWLANVILPEEDDPVVLVLEMPTTLAQEIASQYLDKGGEGTGTKYITGRNFELFRKGTGKNNTRYSFAPDAPSKLNLDKYELIDLEDILSRMGTPVERDEDDADEEEGDDEEETGAEAVDLESMDVDELKDWIEEQGYERPTSKKLSEVKSDAYEVASLEGIATTKDDADEDEDGDDEEQGDDTEDEESEEESTEEDGDEEEAEEESEEDEALDFASMTKTALRKYVRDGKAVIVAAGEYDYPVVNDLTDEELVEWAEYIAEHAEAAAEGGQTGEVYEREYLEGLSLKDLKALAKDAGYNPLEYSKSQMLDLLSGVDPF